MVLILTDADESWSRLLLQCDQCGLSPCYHRGACHCLTCLLHHFLFCTPLQMNRAMERATDHCCTSFCKAVQTSTTGMCPESGSNDRNNRIVFKLELSMASKFGRGSARLYDISADAGSSGCGAIRPRDDSRRQAQTLRSHNDAVPGRRRLCECREVSSQGVVAP